MCDSRFIFCITSSVLAFVLFFFVVEYQGSKTSSDAIVDSVFNGSIFLLREGSVLFFITILPIHLSKSRKLVVLNIVSFTLRGMHSRLCN